MSGAAPVDDLYDAPRDVLSAPAKVIVTREQIQFEVRATYDFAAEEPEELEFHRGDTIGVINHDDAEWWYGRLAGRTGTFPSQFVERLPAPAPERNRASYQNWCPPLAGGIPEAKTPIRGAARSYENWELPSAPRSDEASLAEASAESPASRPATAESATAESVEAATTAEAEAATTAEAETATTAEAETASTAEAEAAATAEAEAAATAEAEAPTTAEAAGQADDEDEVVLGEVMFDYVATSETELYVKAGDTVELSDCEEDEPWWSGTLNGAEGWFPAAYVRVLEGAKNTRENIAFDEDDIDEEEDESRPGASQGGGDGEGEVMSKRARCIEEMLKTEAVGYSGTVLRVCGGVPEGGRVDGRGACAVWATGWSSLFQPWAVPSL